MSDQSDEYIKRLKNLAGIKESRIEGLIESDLLPLMTAIKALNEISKTPGLDIDGRK